MTTAVAGQGTSSPGSSAGTKVESAASTTATSTVSRGNDRSAIEARIAELTGSSETTLDDEEQLSDVDENEKAGDAETQGDKSEKDKGKEAKSEKDKAEKTISQKALQERLGREKKKQEALESKVSERERVIAQREAAIDILGKEVERLTGILKEKGLLDENGEKLREYDLHSQAQARQKEIEERHTKAVKEAADNARRAALRDQLSEEIDSALTEYDLLHRNELIAELKRKENLSRSIAEVAKELQEAKLERAKLKLVKSKPATPSTVTPQRGGSNSAVRHPNTRKGIEARIAELRSMGRG
jgi:hypothetical protein